MLVEIKYLPTDNKNIQSEKQNTIIKNYFSLLIFYYHKTAKNRYKETTIASIGICRYIKNINITLISV